MDIKALTVIDTGGTSGLSGAAAGQMLNGETIRFDGAFRMAPT